MVATEDEKDEKLSVALHNIALALENIRLGNKAENGELEEKIDEIARWFWN